MLTATSSHHSQLSPLSRSSALRNDIFERLLRAVFRREIVEGDRLVVQRLAAQFGVSATPVREALVELEAAGIVEILPNRGAVCRPFGPRQLREIYDLRRILEVEATRTAAGRIPVGQLKELKLQLGKLRAATRGPRWSGRAMDIDRDLHETIAKHNGSDRLAHEIDRYNGLMQAIRGITDNQQNVQLQAIEDHLIIVDALIFNDALAAASAMDHHIRNTADTVVAIMYPESAG